MGSDQERTFGPTVAGLITEHLYPHRVTLWDSKTRGTRPDAVKIIRDLYQAWGEHLPVFPSFTRILTIVA